MQLSPLNFSGLIATAELCSRRQERDGQKEKRYAIECWKCPDCDEVYDDEDEAVECCQDDDHLHTLHDQDGVSLCPICASSNTDARQASDCCLWKDFDAHTRWAMADKVEAGAAWSEVLNIKPH